MMAAGAKFFIYRGSSGEKFYDDLHCIDVSGIKLWKLSPIGSIPTGCAIHLAVVVKKYVYIINWTLPILLWHLLPHMHCTIDHLMPIIPRLVIYTLQNEESSSVTKSCETKKGDFADNEGCDPPEESQTDTLFCFVFDGLDTEQEMYKQHVITVID
ncbi:Rab9 effector protein with kelch motifs [Plecturocebus cupreus]